MVLSFLSNILVREVMNGLFVTVLRANSGCFRILILYEVVLEI